MISQTATLDPTSPIFLYDQNSLVTVIYGIEGAFRMVGTVVLLFLICSFPQRVCCHAYRNKTHLHSDQWALFFQIIIIMLNPLLFIYGAYFFWTMFVYLDGDLDLTVEDNSTIFISVPSLMHALETDDPFAWRFSMFSLALFLLSLFAFPILWFQTQQRHHHSLARKETECPEEDDEDEMTAEELPYGEIWMTKMRIQVRDCWLKIAHYEYACISWDLLFLLTFYFVLLLLGSYGLDINFSYVPLMHFITMLRVCFSGDLNFMVPDNKTLVVPYNFTFDDLSFASNLTVHLEIKSLDLVNTSSLCSPSQPDPILFLRVLMISCVFFVELCLMVYTTRISRATRMFLRGQSYLDYRREILEYQFFRRLLHVMSFLLLTIGLLSSLLNPLDSYIIRNTDLLIVQGASNPNGSPVSLLLVVSADPLYQVGITFGIIGFGSLESMVGVFLLWLCYSALPVDSFGFQGWWCGSKNEKNLALLESQSDVLTLVPEESTILELLKVKEENKKGQHDPISPLLLYGLNKLFHEKNLPHNNNSDEAPDRCPLRLQLNGNFLCLETEILLFHFMHLSYTLANTKLVTINNSTIRMKLTDKEKQELVEDSRFTLDAHIVDETTDTHAFVFSSLDRIVVAFRGSVSVKNWKSDFDFAEVDCPFANQVLDPEYTVMGKANAVRAKRMAEKKAKVHRGFVIAYESVRNRIVDLVRTLRNERPDRVVFVTGHSLGGGLGILCVLDLGIALALLPNSISLTTWGCPKMGNFSFLARFFRIVPSAKRFAMVDDVITKLPPTPLGQSITLSGWWHVGTEILLNSTGQCLIRPTDIERFMFQKTIGNAAAHLRMNYAVSIMIWIVISLPQYVPQWWVSVLTLFHKSARKRLRNIPPNIREVLLETLKKPGVMYRMNEKVVRDMLISTAAEEEDTEAMITELLMAFRLGKKETFERTLHTLSRMQKEKHIPFPQEEEVEEEGEDVIFYDAQQPAASFSQEANLV